MNKRQFLIDARERLHMSTEQAAGQIKISYQLLSWLENDSAVITHPNIARRITSYYKLGEDEFNSMVAEIHRGKYKVRRRPRK